MGMLFVCRVSKTKNTIPTLIVDARPPAHAREARARESRRVGCRALAAAGVVRFKSNRFEPRSRTWRLIVHAIRAHSGTVQGMC